MEKIKNSSYSIRLPLILAVAVSAGILIGAAMVKPNIKSGDTTTNIAKFKEIVLSIDESYVDDVDVPKLIDEAIVDMLKKLDPHTSYIPIEEIERVNAQLKGSYEGIGVQFDIIRDSITVVKPIEEGPSEKIGILAGDRIIQVEDEVVTGIGITNKGVTERLLGKKGSVVNVKVKRPGVDKVIDYAISRGSIAQSTIEASYIVKDDIGYIKVSRFGANTYKDFYSALKELKNEGMKKLILDLQGNPGGYMGAAQKMADELIGGDPIIVSQKGKEESFNSVFRAKEKGVLEEEPIIVLIDEYSASASEIVAGALQDNDRALVVGRRSYGKGLVQMPISLKDGSELRLTIARYYTPSGRCIQKPFEGNDNYSQDITERFNNGEFFHSDSIQFVDSLKYETSKGRTVYGGGGIMPDVFVPYDTTRRSNYYSSLLSHKALREFTLSYYVSNKEALFEMTFDEYKNNFKVIPSDWKRLIRLGEQLGVSYDDEGFKLSKPTIGQYIKAEIARSVWGNDAFYPIYNASSDEIYTESLGLFDEAIKLAMRE